MNDIARLRQRIRMLELELIALRRERDSALEKVRRARMEGYEQRQAEEREAWNALD